MKTFLSILPLMVATFSFGQVAFDDCSDALANPLTVGGASDCGYAVGPMTAEAGECLTNWAGAGNATMWSSFTATNDSMVINYTETTAGGEYLAIYGPNSGCQPACVDEIIGGGQQTGDPGHHLLLTGLTVGGVYLIQVDAAEPNGPSQTALEYCIGVAEPDQNGLSSGASLLDECGVAFTETTDGGYWQSGTGLGFANLDNNVATTCGDCPGAGFPAGSDVPFVINNAAWNTFCSLTSGTWQITVDNVTNCVLTGAGVQAAVFTGTTNALTLEDYSSPVPAGGWVSGTITVDSADCAYLMIDGFAGDICEYDVTLTNISGGCTILPLELLGINAYQTKEGIVLSWQVASETDNDYFIVERSYDGITYEEIGSIKSIGDHSNAHDYLYTDDRYNGKDVYYRIAMVDMDGERTDLGYKFLKRKQGDVNMNNMSVYPNPANESVHISFNYEGSPLVAMIEVYSLMGEKVVNKPYHIFNGGNNLELNLEDVKPGNYVIKLITQDKVFTKSFQKR